MRAIGVLMGFAFGAVVLLVTEMIVRWALPRREPMWTFAIASYLGVQMDNDVTRQSQEYDPRRTWKVRANLRNQEWVGTIINTNAMGLRMDREIGPKQPGEYRIVIAGDSVTFGYCVPFLWEGKLQEPENRPYPEELEKRLRASLPERNIRVIPLACPGYTTLQGRLWLESALPKLQPDLVFACYGWNDIMEVSGTDRQTMPQTFWPLALRHVGQHSQLILHAMAAIPKPQPEINPNIDLPRTSLEDYIANYAAMARLAQREGAAFGIISPVFRDKTSFPHESLRMSEYRKKLRQFAELNMLDFLEVPELTENSPTPNEGFFMEHIHPNHVGHRILADKLKDMCMQILHRPQ